jgi:hypothetical protein
MSLVNFQVQTACFDPKQLLLALSQVIPAQTITDAIAITSSRERRQRRLPTYAIVTLVIAMSFWSSDSIVDVFKNLIHGLSSLQIPLGIRWQVPCSSSITEARQRKQKGHFLGRLPAHAKFVVVKTFADGSYLSWIAPDGKSRKKGATRIPIRIIEYTIEENGTPKTYRLITNLMDTAKFPALMLAQEYHQRWEAENTLDELKIHLNGRKTQIRSKNPREVVQEIYGWLLAHYCLRSLMFQSATLKNISPLRLSFIGSLRVIRRAIPEFQRQINNQLDINTYYSWLIAEISDLEIPLRQHRSNPRVVKKARSKFKSKKRSHRNHGTPRQQLSFQIVKQAS